MEANSEEAVTQSGQATTICKLDGCDALCFSFECGVAEFKYSELIGRIAACKNSGQFTPRNNHEDPNQTEEDPENPDLETIFLLVCACSQNHEGIIRTVSKPKKLRGRNLFQATPGQLHIALGSSRQTENFTYSLCIGALKNMVAATPELNEDNAGVRMDVQKQGQILVHE
ncbi:MAG: hypothetical protein BRC25_01540 [Parcubacteria group bacterium SW_6_46_9]|nr:MAG: hypothetical protein BRC25_01540 [Parcubacteria group bacterium SW_6_46_9]